MDFALKQNLILRHNSITFTLILLLLCQPVVSIGAQRAQRKTAANQAATSKALSTLRSKIREVVRRNLTLRDQHACHFAEPAAYSRVRRGRRAGRRVAGVDRPGRSGRALACAAELPGIRRVPAVAGAAADVLRHRQDPWQPRGLQSDRR